MTSGERAASSGAPAYLVARVIEKGLHLPDAADRLRQVNISATQIAARVAPAVVPTVTLAEIYAAQGHRPRAIEILRRLLEIEPDHASAKALLANLETSPVAAPAVVPLPPEDEDETSVAAGAGASAGEANGLDDAPLPARYDVDECVAIAVDPVTLYVYWEVREASFDHVRRARPEGTLSLRLLIITPSWDGPRSATRDFDVDSAIANRTVRDLPAGAIVRAAIGWRTGDVFLPIAHSPALETPPGAPCPVVAESFVRWTPQGTQPVTPQDGDFASNRTGARASRPRPRRGHPREARRRGEPHPGRRAARAGRGLRRLRPERGATARLGSLQRGDALAEGPALTRPGPRPGGSRAIRRCTA